MFNIANVAMDGMFPGMFSTFGVASLGLLEKTVTIVPVVTSQGGGYVPAAIGQKPDRYRVTIRIIFNGKVYEDTVYVADTRARIIAKLNGIYEFVDDDVMISVNGIQVMTETQTEITASVL